ncbi:MAG TPA: MSHA biogenesis protein MshJ [Noviherbaspirillum sp.]|jgi:MSHA biogenesis protein MshJ|uniref:MSHA biogenesis protein MshJ n=1 Tax=Noviherbaspirillum sp. TaxID=1926288 RepID=UPI002DDCB811|nr:MSHA biogenesis protein MshJ [Noviherbaspirillum sp.]HEV2610411.1 MSHA biogenesis protein MshJ [Noviherbaspirillum sp.]
MKQYWQKISLKIDALSLRERAIIFAMSALILVVLVNTTLLEPQYARQKQLTQRITQEQSLIAGAQAEIKQKAMSLEVDPDRSAKIRLQRLKEQSAELQLALRDLQKGLVTPDKMSVLLEDILKNNDALKLVSLKTLPVASLLGTTAPADIAASSKSEDKRPEQVVTAAQNTIGGAVGGAVYKHGVEIVLQGSYLDTMKYLTQLETMPWQLFWGEARLHVDEYPKATLTLTLFTLSQNEKWLHL